MPPVPIAATTRRDSGVGANMRVARQLLQAAAFAAASLLLVALAVALLVAGLEASSPTEFWGLPGAFGTGLHATLLIGAGPAILIGAPAYWGLWRLGRARSLIVLPLGAALGALVGVLEPPLLGWGAGCGMVVAGLTHLAAKRWMGPDRQPEAA